MCKAPFGVRRSAPARANRRVKTLDLAERSTLNAARAPRRYLRRTASIVVRFTLRRMNPGAMALVTYAAAIGRG